MSVGGELVHFHDWRAARDRKAATRPLWRSRCSGLVTVAVSIGLLPIDGTARLAQIGPREASPLSARAPREGKCWRFYPPVDPLQAALRLAPLIVSYD
jgi:hypothetical protein